MNLVEKLPHKPPALLIGEVLEISEALAICPILGNLDSSLAPSGMLPAPMGLEAMAQTAALWMCWHYKREDAQGMLVQCRNLTMKVRTLDISKPLLACAKPVSIGSATGLYQFEGQIKDVQGNILVSGLFMIFAREEA